MRQTKSLKIEEVNLEETGESGTFSGYASVFDVLDADNDIIERGAYADVILKDKPKMFFNHNSWDVPIGAWTSLEEDEKGLRVEGILAPGHVIAENVKGAMKVNGIDSMSIGYWVDKDGVESKNGIRHIKKIAGLPEISIVTFPANEEATIDMSSIKHRMDGIDSIRELEALIRDEFGVSNAFAKTLLSKCRALHQRDVEGKDSERLYRGFTDALKFTF